VVAFSTVLDRFLPHHLSDCTSPPTWNLGGQEATDVNELKAGIALATRGVWRHFQEAFGQMTGQTKTRHDFLLGRQAIEGGQKPSWV
jgi:hypothetical protein